MRLDYLAFLLTQVICLLCRAHQDLSYYLIVQEYPITYPAKSQGDTPQALCDIGHLFARLILLQRLIRQAHNLLLYFFVYGKYNIDKPKSQVLTRRVACDMHHRSRKKVIHMTHITLLNHAQVIHMTCITIPFVRYVRFVPLNLSHPPVILTSIKKVKKVLTKKGIQNEFTIRKQKLLRELLTNP